MGVFLFLRSLSGRLFVTTRADSQVIDHSLFQHSPADDRLKPVSQAANVALPHAPPQAGVKLTGTTDHGQKAF